MTQEGVWRCKLLARARLRGGVGKVRRRHMERVIQSFSLHSGVAVYRVTLVVVVVVIIVVVVVTRAFSRRTSLFWSFRTSGASLWSSGAPGAPEDRLSGAEPAARRTGGLESADDRW